MNHRERHLHAGYFFIYCEGHDMVAVEALMSEHIKGIVNMSRHRESPDQWNFDDPTCLKYKVQVDIGERDMLLKQLRRLQRGKLEFDYELGGCVGR